MKNNNNNNIWVLYSALLLKRYSQSASHKYYPCSAVTHPRDNPSSREAAAKSAPNDVSYLTGTHLTPGWREAIEIKHLAQGHNVMTSVELEPTIPRSQVQCLKPIGHHAL